MDHRQSAGSTSQAIRDIAAENDLSHDLVKLVVDCYTQKILDCIENEIPFSMKGFGKFYFAYRGGRHLLQQVKNKEYFDGKVHRSLKFQVSSTIKDRVNNWVHDLGLKDNVDKKEMMRLAIKPDEIHKIRRAKVLEEQQQIGFRPDLLFDEDDIPTADKSALNNLDNAPTVNEMMQRLGIDIDD